MAANICASVSAAHPVTTMRAAGRGRFRRGMVWRAWATASAVTAQELITIMSSNPAASTWRRITSDSAAFSRQPKVTTSMLMAASGRVGREHGRRDFSLELDFGGPGHQHVVVALAPFDGKVAARQRDAHLAAGALGARGANRGGAGGGAAGPGQARAAFPGADDQMILVLHLRH